MRNLIELDVLSTVLQAFPQAALQPARPLYRASKHDTPRLPVALCGLSLLNHTVPHFQLLLLATASIRHAQSLPDARLSAEGATTLPLDWFTEHVGRHIRKGKLTAGGLCQIRAICAQVCPAYDTSGATWATG